MRAYPQGNRVLCAACGVELARVWDSKTEFAFHDRRFHVELGQGWMFDSSDKVWRITRRGRERLRDGRRPTYRREARRAKESRHDMIIVPAKVECWHCGETQTIDAKGLPPIVFDLENPPH